MTQREPICSEDGCARLVLARGICNMHYQRAQKAGRLGEYTRAKRADGETLREVQNAVTRAQAGDDACIITGSANRKDNRGRLHFNGKLVLAAHVALILAGKPRPEPPEDNALHLCDNPPCVNPNHLHWGTPGDNSREMVTRRRDASSKWRGLIAWLDANDVEFPTEFRPIER